MDKLVIPQDKANHAFYGLLIYSLVAMYNPLVAVLVVLVVGAGKEVLDKYTNGTVDKWDFVATITAPVFLYLMEI